LAGMLNTFFGFAVYSVLIILGASVWLAILIGMLTGSAFNFITTGGYVFRDLSCNRLPRFVFFYFMIFIINLGMIDQLGIWIDNKILLQAIITPPLAAISYILMGRFVFKSQV
jgi:putative flippase GtrA